MNCPEPAGPFSLYDLFGHLLPGLTLLLGVLLLLPEESRAFDLLTVGTVVALLGVGLIIGQMVHAAVVILSIRLVDLTTLALAARASIVSAQTLDLLFVALLVSYVSILWVSHSRGLPSSPVAQHLLTLYTSLLASILVKLLDRSRE